MKETITLPQDLTSLGTLKAWRQKIRELKPIPPVYVDKAPIRENIVEGEDIDIFKLLAPKWHNRDGGR